MPFGLQPFFLFIFLDEHYSKAEDILAFFPFKKKLWWTPGWLSRLSICLWLRSWSWGPGIEPHIGRPALRGVCSYLSPLPHPHLCSLAHSLSQINKNFILFYLILFLKILFIHSWEREHEQEAEGKREADSPLSREPDVGLDPRTPGSWPDPKVVTQPLSCQASPSCDL